MQNIYQKAKELSQQIFSGLYPLIENQLEKINEETDWEENETMSILLEELEKEFHSLAYYENKLVFPSVMDCLQKEKSPQSHVNVEEIERLTTKKENHLLDLCKKIQYATLSMDLPPKHSIFGLVFLFQNAFVTTKSNWLSLLKTWAQTKVCPSAN